MIDLKERGAGREVREGGSMKNLIRFPTIKKVHCVVVWGLTNQDWKLDTESMP